MGDKVPYIALYREEVVGKENKTYYKYYYITKDEYGEKKNYINVSYDTAADLNRIYEYLNK